jgi:tetratricopeptide (TPR) repeat protein
VRRRVALKVIKPGMDSRQVIARFEAERQALALMDHPNIARIFDAGTTEGGRPYFVMELVRGVPITEFCDQSKYTTRQRLGLFRLVCQAVQHAHQKGVIHRDLKPSNVLVTLHDTAAVPKVIDFGIAKATAEPLTDRTPYTQFAQMIGTPLYMSPEQAQMSGLDVDTRSDVYSLGVLLYELLSGTTPFDKERLKGAGYDEVRRIIREEEPPRPSTRLSTLGAARTTAAEARGTDARRLAVALRGELDWVVMKAIEKDRDRRYESAGAFAADIERYLADEPVQACPPSAAYRLRKFARRNKAILLPAAVVASAVLLGSAVSVWKYLGEREARADADAARASAEERLAMASDAVERYLDEVPEDPDLRDRHGLHGLRKRLLQTAVPFYEKLAEQKPGDAKQEAARARAYGRLAKVRELVGETEAARADYEEERDIYARLAAEHPDVPEFRHHLAGSLNNLALLLKHQGKREEAESNYRAALKQQERLVAENPAAASYRHQLANIQLNLGTLLVALGKPSQAEGTLRTALESLQRLAAEQPNVPALRRSLAQTLNNLGTLLQRQGKRMSAEESYRAALKEQQRLATEHPAVPAYRHEAAKSLINLGNVLDDVGKPSEAEASYHAALKELQRLAAEHPQVPEYRHEMAKTHSNRGVLRKEQGKLAKAAEAFRAALKEQELLAASFPAEAEYRQALALSHKELGVILRRQNKPAEAEAAFRKAIEVEPGFAAAHTDLGITLKDRGKLAEAEAAYREAFRHHVSPPRTSSAAPPGVR